MICGAPWLAGLLSRAEKLFRSRIIVPTRPNPDGIFSSRWGGVPPPCGGSCGVCVVRVTCVVLKLWHLRAGYPASNLKRFLKRDATRIEPQSLLATRLQGLVVRRGYRGREGGVH